MVLKYYKTFLVSIFKWLCMCFYLYCRYNPQGDFRQLFLAVFLQWLSPVIALIVSVNGDYCIQLVLCWLNVMSSPGNS